MILCNRTQLSHIKIRDFDNFTFDGVWFVLLDGIFLDYLTLRLKMMMKLLIPYRNFPDQFVKYTRCDVT